MKTKTIALSLAAMMSVQSVGLANADRTSGMEIQAVQQAQKDIETLKAEILKVDQSLEAAATAIEKRDNRGGITNGTAVTGAAIGVLASAMGYFVLQTGKAGSGAGAIFLGLVSGVTSLGAVISGFSSQMIKPDVETAQVQTELTSVKNKIELALSQPQDKATTSALNQLRLSLNNAQSALNDYKRDETLTSRSRMISQAVQLAGAMAVGFAFTRKEADKILGIAVLAMNAGNLGAIISGFMSEDTEAVLKEIKQTREALATVSL